MTCIPDGKLRARLDGELDEAERKDIETHLATCIACRERAKTIAGRAGNSDRALANLAPAPGDPAADAALALARFRAAHADAPDRFRSWPQRVFGGAWRPAWASVAVFALMVVGFSFAPVRGWAQKILAMLRIQKVVVVPIDAQFLPGPRSAGIPAKMINQFISDDVVVTMKPGDPQTAADAEQAGQLAGFTVRLLSGRSDAPEIKVFGEQGFQMTLNRDHLQTILEDIGRGDLALPATLDGELVAVHIPKVVMAGYGRCPSHSRHDPQGPLSVSDFMSCVVLAQVPSPTVSVPPELNIQQLAEVGLQAAGMSAQDARSFCQTVDWTSTLVVPIPRDAGSYSAVSVDGVQGTLIAVRGYDRRPPGYLLLWVKTGIVYSLTGFGSSEQAVPLADSLE